MQKVADSSGSKYSGGSTSTTSFGSAGPPPPSSKPVFMPNRVGGAGSFNPLGSRSRAQPQQAQNTDEDGWGEDAPQITRTQLEKVQPAYKPTKVNISDLTNQKQEPSRYQQPSSTSNGSDDVVRGGYQPIGKVDIGAIRRQAQESGQVKDDRPSTIKGSYEPVGKVDIAAIRAKAQGAPQNVASPSPAETSEQPERPKSLADRSAAFQSSERMTAMPKPKVANRFGSQTGSFAGTRAPAPGGFEAKPLASAAPVGTASKTFADEGGKTPAQVWAEKKARERGNSGAAQQPPSSVNAPTSPMQSQPSGGWQSGYVGKKWGSVQTTRTGQSNISDQKTGQSEPETEEPQTGGVGSIRDRFRDAPPMGSANIDQDDEPAAPPPPMNFSSKPNAGARGVPMPGLPQRPLPPDHPEAPEAPEDHEDEEHVDLPSPPPQPARSPSPDMPGSPVRIAMPVSRGARAEEIETHEPPPMPASSISKVVSARSEEPEAEEDEEEDFGRGAAQAAAASTFGAGAATAAPGADIGGKRALVQYDYEKAEDNEIELREGEYVTNIEMVDEDWWMGQNSQGETGLFPSNYVELAEDEGGAGAPSTTRHSEPEPEPEVPAPSVGAFPGKTATAQYDYEATEDNELSFPDGATIHNVVSESSSPHEQHQQHILTFWQEFPDEDWWLGEFNGKQGLFPANYVVLDE